VTVRQWHGRLIRAITRPPYQDQIGHKGVVARIAGAQPHLVRTLQLEIAGWPRWSRPLRVAFLSDFHTGSHSDDVARLAGIVAEAQTFNPDLVLFGGDFVNMQLFGGGRVPPRIIAATLAQLNGPCGQFAVLGNHDYTYGVQDVADALSRHGITVLADERCIVNFEDRSIGVVGIPDARVERAGARQLLAALAREHPAIVLAHDPIWFAAVPPGPHLTLAGHTHGGQIRFPVVGALKNASKAPLRWTYGLIRERGQYLYVTSGIGTSGIPLRWRAPPEFVVLDVTGPL
jgi:predicted MPP superfamily phosphohydrolase